MSATSGLPPGVSPAARSMRWCAVLWPLWVRPSYRWPLTVTAAAAVCGGVLLWTGAAPTLGMALLLFPGSLLSLLAWTAVLQSASEQGTAERLQLIPGLRRQLIKTLIGAWIILALLPPAGVLLTFAHGVVDDATRMIAVEAWFAAGAFGLATGWLVYRPLFSIVLIAAPLVGLNFFSLLNPYSVFRLRDDGVVSIAAWAVVLLLATVASAFVWVGRAGEAQARRDRLRRAAAGLLLPGGSSADDPGAPTLRPWLQRVQSHLDRWSDRLTVAAAMAAPDSPRGLQWAIGEHTRLLRLWLCVLWIAGFLLLMPASMSTRLAAHLQVELAAFCVAGFIVLGTATNAWALHLLANPREELALWQLSAQAPPRSMFGDHALRLLLRTALGTSVVTFCGMALSTLLWLDATHWHNNILTLAQLSVLPWVALAWSPRDSGRQSTGIWLAVLLFGVITAAVYGITMTHPLGWAVSASAAGLAFLALAYRITRLRRRA